MRHLCDLSVAQAPRIIKSLANTGGKVMPFLIRFMLRHAAIGFALGAMAAAIVVAADIAGLRSLAAATSLGWVGLAAFCFLMGLSAGGLQIGFATMLLPYDDDRPGKDGGHRQSLRPIPVRVSASPPRTLR